MISNSQKSLVENIERHARHGLNKACKDWDGADYIDYFQAILDDAYRVLYSSEYENND